MGHITHIFVCPTKGQSMRSIHEVEAIENRGLVGDRYVNGTGSWNQGKPGKRQVTLINLASFRGTDFEPHESRRNIVTEGIELMTLISKTFRIGSAIFTGEKYCYPCDRPDKLSGKFGFADQFCERGGLIARVNKRGFIRVGDVIEPFTADVLSLAIEDFFTVHRLREARVNHKRFRVRLLTELDCLGVKTVGDLVSLSPEKVQSARGIGSGTFNAIWKGLKTADLWVGMKL